MRRWRIIREKHKAEAESFLGSCLFHINKYDTEASGRSLEKSSYAHALVELVVSLPFSPLSVTLGEANRLVSEPLGYFRMT